MDSRSQAKAVKEFLTRWKHVLAGIIVAGAALSYACSDDAPPGPTTAQSSASNAAMAPSEGRLKFAPRGVPMPDTGIFTLIPAPYEPSEGPPPMIDLPNVAATMHVPGRRRPVIPPRPQINFGTDAGRGWTFPGRIRGIYAGFDVMEDPLILPPQTVPRGWLIYAPTALPHGPGCFEVTNYHGEDPPGSGLGVWNWCNGSTTWYYMTPINNTTFRSNYVRSYVDPYYGTTRQRYFIQVLSQHPDGADRSNDTWQALIYAWSIGGWVSLGFPYTGAALQSQLNVNGWLMHETRNLAARFDGQATGICYQIRSTAASEVRLRGPDGTWNPPAAYAIPSELDSATLRTGGANDCFNYNSTDKPWNFWAAWSWGWIAKTPSVTP